MVIQKYKLKEKRFKIVLLIVLILIMNITAQAQTLSLEQCIDTALIYNRNIKLSQQDVDISTEKNKEIRGNLLPKLNGIADYRYYTDLPYQLMPAAAFGGPEGTYKEVQFGVPQSLNANLQLAVPIFNSTALNAIKSTRIATELSEIQKTKTDEDVVLEVSNAYYNAQILLTQITFLDSNIINTGKLVKTTTLLYQQQIAKGTDVDRLKLQVEQITTQRSTVISQYQQVLNALKFLMGKPISDSIEVLNTEKSIVKSNFQSQVTTDVLLIDKKIEFNNSELSGIRNLRLPSLSAYGVYGTTGFGTTGSNSFFNFHPIGYVGAQLSVPLFNGRVTQHKIAGKKIEIIKSNIQKEIVTEKSKLDLKNAEMQYALATRNITMVSSQTDLAKKIYDNTVLQNQQGVANITDLLLADNALRETQQNYLVALINLRRAELEYKRVTGNLITIKK
ncbi:MAG TPA: TolC family protein [Candidatus Margulisbacteria bacterium]|nr:TolC family protein [Candidatus Margulisiibacteriota bacterium]